MQVRPGDSRYPMRILRIQSANQLLTRLLCCYMASKETSTTLSISSVAARRIQRIRNSLARTPTYGKHKNSIFAYSCLKIFMPNLLYISLDYTRSGYPVPWVQFGIRTLRCYLIGRSRPARPWWLGFVFFSWSISELSGCLNLRLSRR